MSPLERILLKDHFLMNIIERKRAYLSSSGDSIMWFVVALDQLAACWEKMFLNGKLN